MLKFIADPDVQVVVGDERRRVKTRDLPPDIQARTDHEHSELYRAIKAAHPEGDTIPIAAHVLLISGCRDDQVSRDGSSNGLFTGALLKVWDGGRFQGDHAALHAAVAKLIEPVQSPQLSTVGAPSGEFLAQRPLAL
jgi:hypothetical protein